MLAQNFKSADDLEISDEQKDALIKTLVLMETGKLRHVPFKQLAERTYDDPKYDGLFNMAHSYIVTDCGTVACIKGTAELISGVSFYTGEMPPQMVALFYWWKGVDPSVEQAATALRSYLTTGDPQWDLAVS